MKFTFLFTGRLTQDASIRQVSNDRTAMNFTVAVNDYYKKKGATEYQQEVSYVDCAYWRSPKEAQAARLTKGSLVQIDGFIRAEAFLPEGKSEPVAKLACRVEDYVILAPGKHDEDVTAPGIDEIPEGYYDELENKI